MAASYRKTRVLESLFNSKYCKNFNSTYFEDYLQMAASGNVFMKLTNIQIYYISIRNKFMTGISLLVSHEVYIHITRFLKEDQKFKKRNDKWKTFSENYKVMRVCLQNLPRIIVARDFSPSPFKLKRGILPLLTNYVS